MDNEISWVRHLSPILIAIEKFAQNDKLNFFASTKSKS